MKTLQILNNEVNSLLNETSFYLVNVREDNYENTNDANLSESTTFDNLTEAFDFFQNEILNIKNFATESEYKEIELILNDEDDIFMVLETESYVAQYSAEDYGKYILHYLPKNNGVSVKKIEIIDEKTNFFVNFDDRFSMKSEIYNTKNEVIDAIYHKSLYISMDDAVEIFEMTIR
jgi:hypothetical protein